MTVDEVVEAEIAKFLPILVGMTPELTANTRSVLKLLHSMKDHDPRAMFHLLLDVQPTPAATSSPLGVLDFIFSLTIDTSAPHQKQLMLTTSGFHRHHIGALKIATAGARPSCSLQKSSTTASGL